ncbi:hypothetical protein B0H14DRAFT_2567431 [Mycena olivaceomarginata]|nr:hypothetical protein B0H14DRAFT_2567431 [Mycena olivaceomarginata]
MWFFPDVVCPRIGPEIECRRCEYGLLEVPPELGVLFVEAQRSLDRGISVAMEGGRLCGSPLAYMRDEDFLRRAVEQVERYRMREGRFNDEHHFRLLKLAKLPGCTFPMGFGIAAVNKDRLQGAVESTPPPTPPTSIATRVVSMRLTSARSIRNEGRS